jgi:hypothetical protein
VQLQPDRRLAVRLRPVAVRLPPVPRATGYEIDKNWAHMASVQAFVLGLLVFVIGQVMQVGREIEEDREAFV